MENIQKNEIKNWLIFSIGCLILLIFVFIYIFYIHSKKIEIFENQKNNLNQEIKNLEYRVEKYKIYPEHKKINLKNLEKIEYYNSKINREFHVNVIQDVASRIPLNIFLADLNIAKYILLGGYSDNVKAVLDLLDELSKLPYICNGKIVKLKTEEQQTNMLEFAIKLDIKPCKEIPNAQN